MAYRGLSMQSNFMSEVPSQQHNYYRFHLRFWLELRHTRYGEQTLDETFIDGLTF